MKACSSPLAIGTASALTAALLGLSSCSGIFDNVYDAPPETKRETQAGQLYVDASDWGSWHYIDLNEVNDSTSADSAFNPSALWRHYTIPLAVTDTSGSDGHIPGIYTYWYDVFGAGLSNYEYRDFYPTAPQPGPESWSLAVHRNNVRTNSGAVARTGFRSFDELPAGTDWIADLTFHEDEWNEKDVWTIQDQMLLGIIGNQGIEINNTLSSWLTIAIPPMPPAFTYSDNVFILRLADGSLAALQLENYLSDTGTKCCLTINYMYPL